MPLKKVSGNSLRITSEYTLETYQEYLDEQPDIICLIFEIKSIALIESYKSLLRHQNLNTVCLIFNNLSLAYHFGDGKTLYSYNISWTHITSALQEAPNITILYLHSPRFESHCALSWYNLKQFENLYLSFDYHFNTDPHRYGLPRSTLDSIEICDFFDFTNENLKTLQLYFSYNHNKRTIAKINNNVNINKLNLSSCYIKNYNISGITLNRLTHLNLSYNTIGIEGFLKLNYSEVLTELVLDSCNIHFEDKKIDFPRKFLANFPNLYLLSLENNRIGIVGISVLSESTQLNELKLSCESIAEQSHFTKGSIKKGKAFFAKGEYAKAIKALGSARTDIISNREKLKVSKKERAECNFLLVENYQEYKQLGNMLSYQELEVCHDAYLDALTYDPHHINAFPALKDLIAWNKLLISQAKNLSWKQYILLSDLQIIAKILSDEIDIQDLLIKNYEPLTLNAEKLIAIFSLAKNKYKLISYTSSRDVDRRIPVDIKNDNALQKLYYFFINEGALNLTSFKAAVLDSLPLSFFPDDLCTMNEIELDDRKVKFKSQSTLDKFYGAAIDALVFFKEEAQRVEFPDSKEAEVYSCF